MGFAFLQTFLEWFGKADMRKSEEVVIHYVYNLYILSTTSSSSGSCCRYVLSIFRCMISALVVQEVSQIFCTFLLNTPLSLSPCVYKYKTTVYNYKVTEQTNRFQTQLGPDEGSDKV